MREELEAIIYNKEEGKIIYPLGDETPIRAIEYVETDVKERLGGNTDDIFSIEDEFDDSFLNEDGSGRQREESTMSDSLIFTDPKWAVLRIVGSE